MEMNWFQLAALGAAVAGGLWAFDRYVPDFVANKIHDAIQWLKTNEWMRNPAKPHRLNLLVALLKFIEAEVPDPGEGQELYDALGNEIASRLKVGRADRWAASARKLGDKIDTELDDDIKKLLDEQK